MATRIIVQSSHGLLVKTVVLSRQVSFLQYDIILMLIVGSKPAVLRQGLSKRALDST